MPVRRYGFGGASAMFGLALVVSAGSFRAQPLQPEPRPQPGQRSPAVPGVQGCAYSECHAAEYRWLTSEPGGREHYNSLITLRQAQAKAAVYAQAVGLSSVDAPGGLCMRCHATPAGISGVPQGLACEACHGPAAGYLALHAGTPRDYEGAVQRGLRNLRGEPVAWIRVCRDCHVLADRAVYRVLLTAGHPDGAGWKASSAYTSLQRHWKTSYTVATIDAAEKAVRARALIFDRPSGGGGAPAAGSSGPPTPAAPAVSQTRQPMPDFPWPPPAPSTQTVLPDSLFRATGRPSPSLSAVGATLVRALQRARYFEYSYYRAPNGFALVARLERIDADGTPLPEEFRFLLPGSREPFSVAAYVKQLFFAPTGLYRMIVFAVTDLPFTATGAQLDAVAAGRLLSQGTNTLPRDFDDVSFTDSHRVTALIYEFRKGTGQGDVSTLTPSRLGARAHLDKSGIYPALSLR